MQWFLGTNGYGYNDFGALSTVTDPNSNQYGIKYTPAGQVDSLLLGTGVTEDRNYDSDGRLTYRSRVSSSGPPTAHSARSAPTRSSTTG